VDVFIHRSVKSLALIGQGALFVALLVLAGCTPHAATASLLLGGDVILYRGGDALFSDTSIDGSPWGDVLRIRTDEPSSLFAVNLESPFGLIAGGVNTGNLDMNLCADDSAVTLLQQAELNLATYTNNHARDCGDTKSAHTQQVLEDAGISSQGEESDVLYLPVGEQTVAFISLNDYDGNYELDAIEELLGSARRESDLVVVSVHWGSEYQGGPTRHQEQLAGVLVDAGADLVWGHHPHVLQRMEWVPSTVDGHTALVMYSLGNLLSDQWMLPDALRTTLVKIEFEKHQVKAVSVIPLVMDFETGSLSVVRDQVTLQWFNERLGLDELENIDVIIEPWQPEFE
jgi:hypothetical protein